MTPEQREEPLSAEWLIRNLRTFIAPIARGDDDPTFHEKRAGELLGQIDSWLDTARSGPASPTEGLDVERLAEALTFDPDIAPQPKGRVRRKWWRLGWLSALAVARDRLASSRPSTEPETDG
jgi:hypothetical protein